MRTLTEPAYIAQLRDLEACREALEFCQNYPTWPEAWAACPNHSWLIWLAERAGLWTEETQSQYCRVTAPALAEYRRVEAPAWAEFQRVEALTSTECAKDAAWAAYECVKDAAWAEYRISLFAAIRSLVPCPALPNS